MMYGPSNLSGLSGEVLVSFLLLDEGQTIGTLIHGGVTLMGADFDLIQRAIVLQCTVVCTLGHGAFNRLVCLHIHSHLPPF